METPTHFIGQKADVKCKNVWSLPIYVERLQLTLQDCSLAFSDTGMRCCCEDVYHSLESSWQLQRCGASKEEPFCCDYTRLQLSSLLAPARCHALIWLQKLAQDSGTHTWSCLFCKDKLKMYGATLAAMVPTRIILPFTTLH
ncbi:hypothetical protein KIL84_001009 [Mauremys mutica]|uniref:Uncharacterized protein n=1 Tax=Mauremys mutica TaxID=74926 RepID=A0A9D4ATP4_9SAUR|nr:hypothetical protein KIL84_001009 [Mauremys mutica]